MDQEKVEDEKKLTFGVDVAAMIPRLTQEIAAEMKAKALQSLQYEIQSAVTDTCREYIKERIAPEVAKELEGVHVEIRAAFLAAVTEASKAVAEKLVTSTRERLASYEGAEIVRTILRDLVQR